MQPADPADTEQRQQPPEEPVLTASTSDSRRVTWSESHQYHQLPSAVSTGTLSQNPDGEHSRPAHTRHRTGRAFCNLCARNAGDQKVGCWTSFKQQVKALKHEVLALHYAIQDPRTPFLAKLLPLVALGYALSPLDLIPDFIPILGLVDDLLILPGLIWLSLHLIPHQVQCSRQGGGGRLVRQGLLEHMGFVSGNKTNMMCRVWHLC